jgi:hypothetical protein
MEHYFKDIENDYITAISTGAGLIEISKEEYDTIMEIIRNRPIPSEGFDYRLRSNLTWEEFEIEIIPEDDLEISNYEFMRMIEEVL